MKEWSESYSFKSKKIAVLFPLIILQKKKDFNKVNNLYNTLAFPEILGISTSRDRNFHSVDDLTTVHGKDSIFVQLNSQKTKKKIVLAHF